jgi:serine/threonine-protein kinase
VHLADFSIVRLVADAHTKLTTTGRVMGTPSYMAPEQISGTGTLGPAADIYSLGMVVYEMVTGRVAFDSGTLMELIRQHVQDDPPAPRQLRPDLTPPAEAAVLRALAKDPNERYSTGAEFSQAFTDGLHGRWAAGLTAYVPGAKAAAAAWAHDATTAPAGQGAPVPVRPRRRSGVGVLLTAAILLLTCSLLYVGISGGSVGNFENALALLGVPGFGRTPTTGTTLGAVTSTATTRVVIVTSTPGPQSGGGGGGGPSATPTATFTPGPTPTDTATPTDTPTPTPTPTPTDTPTPYPTPTNTPCPFLNGGSGVTFYAGSNYSGQSWNWYVSPGNNNAVANLPSGIAGHLNSFLDGNEAWHVVLYQSTNGTGNLGHFDNSQPNITTYWQATQSVKIYVNRTC